MSFRKRNVGISNTAKSGEDLPATATVRPSLHGSRPSPLDGRPTTSTGTATLDNLLAGHGGLPLGSSLLIEENGTTDYAGALLRFYAAEGLLQGHHVHVVALPEQWGRELPGAVNESDKKETPAAAGEKMKIAWRYESLGQHGRIINSRAESPGPSATPGSSEVQPSDRPKIFCHTFDLTKRLAHPAASKLDFLPLGMNPTQSPFTAVLEQLSGTISSSPTDSGHRIIVPSLLSPALYPPHASLPEHVLQFAHGTKALLAAYSGRVTAVMSLPLSLYPRSSGVVRWIELLSDGVLELAPFPHSADIEPQGGRGSSSTIEEPPQGLLRVHKLPILHERGSGNNAPDDDWTFALSRRKFIIKPFNLPPIEGDTEAQHAAGSEKKGKKADMEF